MVTLEISSTDIRIIEVNGGKINRWASLALEPGIFEDDNVADTQALGNAVKQLMSSSGIRDKNLIVSVNSLFSLVRIVTVGTPLETTVTEEAVLEATEEVMPLTSEAMYYSWQTIAAGEGGQQVMIVGVPKDVIDDEMLALRSAGINPRVLDLKTLALARAVGKDRALILNIDSTSFDVVVVVDGIPELVRSTAWISTELSQDERVDHLISNLEITVDFFNSHHPDTPLLTDTSLFITGQLSGDFTLVEKITHTLGYPVEQIDPPLEYPPHLPVSQFAVNIGLALKTDNTPKRNINFSLKKKEPVPDTAATGHLIPDINLLPSLYKPWRPTTRQIYYFLAFLATTALLLPLYNLTSGSLTETAALETKYASVNTLIELRKGQIAQREPLQRAVDDYDKLVAIGGGLVEDLNTITALAENLSIVVGSIVHSGAVISFSGEAEDFKTFREFIGALEASGRFLNPVIPPERYPNVTGGGITLNTKPPE